MRSGFQPNYKQIILAARNAFNPVAAIKSVAGEPCLCKWGHC